MRKFLLILSLMLLILFLFQYSEYADGSDNSQESQVELLIKDANGSGHQNIFGLYGRAWVDYLLTDSKSMNFDSIIYQYADTAFLSLQDRVDEIKKIIDSSHHVVVNMSLKNRHNEIHTNSEYLRRAKFLLDQVDAVKLDITLGEENYLDSINKPKMYKCDVSECDIYGYLQYSYIALKKSHPQHSYFQWFTPRKKLLHQFSKYRKYDSVRTPYLLNDGWVFDQYHLSSSDYSELAKLYALDAKEKNTKSYSVIWASPDWIIERAGESPIDKKDTAALWWNESGWKYFYNRVATNINYKLPTYFFMFTHNTKSGRLKPLHSSDSMQCHHDFLRQIEKTVLKLKDIAFIDPMIPLQKPDWIPIFDECAAED